MSIFRPEKMAFLTIYIVKNKINEIIAFLVKAGLIQFTQKQVQVPKKDLKLVEKVKQEKSRITSLLTRVMDIARHLNADFSKYDFEETILKPMQPMSSKIIKEEVSKLEVLINPMLDEIATADKKLNAIYDFENAVKIFYKRDIKFKDLFKLKFTLAKFYKVHKSDIPVMKRGLERISYVLESHEEKNFSYILIIIRQEDEQGLDNVMRGINATTIKVPSFYKRWDKSIKALIENIELDIWTLKESTVESQMELNHKKIEFEQKLFLWYVYLIFHLQISDLKNNFTITESGFLINGWIPVRNLNELEESLSKYDDNSTLVYKIMEYNSEHPELETEDEIPISLTGNKILKPFSGLVSNYGFPKYGDLNPLPLVLFTYIFMFGLMFGDIGHGGLILGAGLFFILNPFKALSKVKDFGWILIACGTSSIIFGILFGSIFGKEDILHHIWFSPMEEINLLLVFGLIIGVTVISLGMILMIIQSFLKHKIEEAFFGEWGILSLSFYWIIGIVSVLIISGVWSLKANLLIIIILFAAPLVLLLFKEPISSLFSKKKEPGAEHKEKEGLFVSVINLFIFIIDIFSNSLSHLRLSAFALTHAAMSGAIFLIARALSSMIRGSFGQGVINWIIFILGTILIILLEGLIVGIQAMRLNYYEFFSKFFEGGGKEFKPVKLITKDVLNFKK